MSVTELIPIIRTLPISDKWQLLNLLQIDVAQTENISPLEHHQTYPWWTPYPASGVAEALLKFMQGARWQPSKATLPLLTKNKNTLEIHLATEVGEMHADLTKVRQIILNL